MTRLELCMMVATERSLPFGKGDHVLVIGDSITDVGRRESAAPYGRGYVNLLRALTAAQAPELHLRWTNRGVAGDTVRDLAGRWQTDVLDERPDWLLVKIGINDCWRGIEGQPGAVPVEEYRDTLASLVGQAVSETGCRVVLASPYLIEGNLSDPWRVASDRYVAAAHDVARDLGLPIADVQAAFDRVLAHTEPADWAGDRVHPDLPGHAVIAGALLDTLHELAARPVD